MSSTGQSSAPPGYGEIGVSSSPSNVAFDNLVQRREIPTQMSLDLLKYIPQCKVVLLCDDSASMSNSIASEGKGAFLAKSTTRWLELQQLAFILIEFVTALCPDGMDIHFLNRNGIANARNVTDMAPLFTSQPDGSTPLYAALQKAFQTKVASGQLLLVLVICDGESSDSTHSELLSLLQSKPRHIHVSFVECTDDEESMEWLDRFDNIVQNFDNTDDYREEAARVLALQGPNFKFTRNDYVAKILLATFLRTYFNLDQRNVGNSYTNNNTNSNNYGYLAASANSYQMSSQPAYSTQTYTQSSTQPYSNSLPLSTPGTSNYNSNNDACCIIQ
ncbi:MAG: hypothetical protein Sylvanvirus6_14 [Sylvanvirus sp.]|uniref:VWFA domain-containing protein n=1 Tax=Sylvanvirus sp. TaxID=2487774 RepID=A0A3G5AKC7_9VIRU|nr:MAG: hypothetical protein Sylvanvirus6_14 [Sylvanvirus sp.]